MNISLIILGLIGLWLGTRYIINSAYQIAQKFNLSHSFVGVGILAVGTDLPEIVVTLKASWLNLKGIESSGIITGNAIGSSISQITLILGIAGLFLKFSISKKELWRDGITLISSIILLFVIGFDGIITRLEGSIMLIGYLIYYILLVKTKTNDNSYDNSILKKKSNIALTGLLITGFFLLIISSHLVVDNAMLLANEWGVAQSFVGIVIVGIGTSLPELAVSVGAAIKKSAGMSVGNIIGSNIFDGLIPIGLGSVISATSIEHSLLTFDLVFLLVATILVLIFFSTKRGISTIEGISLVGLFFTYLAIKLFYFNEQLV